MDVRINAETALCKLENARADLRDLMELYQPESAKKTSDAIYAIWLADDALRQAMKLDEVKCLRCQNLWVRSLAKACDCCGSGSYQVIDHDDASHEGGAA